MAQGTDIELALNRVPRANLLLMGMEKVVELVLERLLPDLPTPIETWCPAKYLALPPAATPGTLILRDVGALTSNDQRRLLEWLEQKGDRTQVISTTATPLLSRLHAGGFLDTLYYRLNTVYVEVTA